jgi:hypothetical protein
MITTKFRRFDFKDGNIVMTPKREGEFIHVNDIELYLREQQRLLGNMKTAYHRSDPPSEWDKKYEYGLDEKISLINSLIEAL